MELSSPGSATAELSGLRSAVRMFLVVCPALIAGTLLSSLILGNLRAIGRVPYSGYAVVVIAGFAAGVAAGLIVQRVSLLPQLITAAVVDVVILGGILMYAAGQVVRKALLPLPWATVLIGVPVGTAIQLLTLCATWRLKDRQR
ncbi:hypothetical protein FOE78_12440 [Microlunatus elymi]|uniref:Uncharacterized protein n=1 Tax=Microlunatus elymi TaxID=2596828 RepID=A0A516Q068_9ACTN|nr:hypothetical protein [Microlunatus elymi]QDP96611.1 hypothetical protein FOE78_12440 [Microlunatus elymi]